MTTGLRWPCRRGPGGPAVRVSGSAEVLRRPRSGRRGRLRDPARRRSSACSARTAPARRRSSRSSRATGPAPPARSRCSARTPQDDRTALRDRIGIVLQESGIDPDLSVRESVEIYGAAYSRRRPTDECSTWSAWPRSATPACRPSRAASGGASTSPSGVVGEPDLIFLDEPTTGFDPEARRRSWELIDRFAARARRSCSPPTTWRRRSGSPTASRCSRPGGSSPTARRRSWPPPSARPRSASASPTASPPTSCRCPPAPPAATARSPSAPPSPTADLAPLLGWAAERRIELQGLTSSGRRSRTSTWS